MNTRHGALINGVLLFALVITLSAVAQEDAQYVALSVVVFVDKNGKQKNSGLQLTTNTEGKTSFDGVPYGPLRVQVLAQGFQTFGEDYVVDKPEMEITIKLKRPQGQYSVYEDHPEEKKEDKKDDAKPS